MDTLAKLPQKKLETILAIEQAKAQAEQAKAQAEQAKAQAEQAKAQAEQAKAQAEQAKVAIQKEKTKQLHLQLEKRKRDEDENKDRKRIKADPKESVTLSSEVLDSYIGNPGFYNLNVKHNIYDFDITKLLHNYNDVNEDMINVIKTEFDHLKSMKNISENQIQKTFNQLLICLFSQFNDSTSLKYLDTSNIGYLKSKAPDCSFIYKNVNIDVTVDHQSLQDFVVCIGELKSSKTSIDAPATVGQLLRYLTNILEIQQRDKVYGFITNITCIRFYYAEKDDNESIVYYESENFEMFHGLPKKSLLSSSSSVNPINTSAPTRCFNEKTLKIFIKFLTMNTNFYGYTALNINVDDYLYDDIFHIKMRLGNGATSFVYLLENNNNDNQLIKDSNCPIIKISKHDKYSKYFINEVKILEKLKESNNSNNFDLFFENVFNSSPTGKFILFKKFLNKLETLTLTQSKQLINVIEYLHNCHIIHRDIRPKNIMCDFDNRHIKLIDFGFATTVEDNEITKKLPIEGTISFGTLKLLKFCSKLPLDLSCNIDYEYERTFDLYCALNIIMIMTDESKSDRFYAIKQESTYQKRMLQIYNFWLDLKKENKVYSKLLKLIDNLNESSNFHIIINNLEKLPIFDN